MFMNIIHFLEVNLYVVIHIFLKIPLRPNIPKIQLGIIQVFMFLHPNHILVSNHVYEYHLLIKCSYAKDSIVFIMNFPQNQLMLDYTIVDEFEHSTWICCY